MTITEKILARAADRAEVNPDDNVWVDIDLLMTHDICGPGSIGVFKEKFGEDARVWDKQKIVIIPDHYIFTCDEKSHRNIEILRQFVAEQDIKNFYDVGTENYKGVCHVTLAEEGYDKPGIVLLGTDSHSCTAGAFGEFATGIGNTEAGFVMGTGKLWLKVPETIRFVFDGELPDYLMAKDLILTIIGDIGTDGATYKAMEFTGDAVFSLNMDERMTLCNMAVEAGAKNGIIEPDQVTLDYVDEKLSKIEERADKSYEVFRNDDDAKFESEHIYNVEEIEPVVAVPHSPGNKEKAINLSDVKIDQAYIGSCTGGKLIDFIAAAKIIKGNQVKVKTFIVPATTQIEQDLNTKKIDGKSLKDIFEDAGAMIGPPSCAACLGGPEDTFGRLKGSDICISTTNRNFPGRMGSKDSQVYLASPLTVAASALTGKITDVRKYMG